MSGLILIGSQAIKAHYPDFPREPKDVDVITPSTLEVGFGDLFSHPNLDEWVGDTNRVATPDELYTLKVSHSYWELRNGSWEKHIYDARFLKRKGCSLIPDLHSVLYKTWAELHGPKRTNLSMEKDSFFKDAVKRIYDHDSIHDSVAYSESALYNQILKDGSTVDVDPGKLWSLPFDQLVLLFREEVYATALERILIPTSYRFSAGAAYRWALRRTITSLTKGKSATFIVDNFEEFASPYDGDNYLERHLKNRDRLVRL